MPDAPVSTDAPAAPAATVATPPDTLGEGGIKALQAERDARAAAEKSAKDTQIRIAELEAELKKRDDAQLSETDKLRKELAEAQAKSTKAEGEKQQTLTRAAIEREAARLRFTDPADAWGLLDAAAIEYDADGKPSNARALLEALAKAKPYLTGSGKPSALPGGGATPSNGVSMDDWLRQQARVKGR